jgi:hypothetical protein
MTPHSLHSDIEPDGTFLMLMDKNAYEEIKLLKTGKKKI